MQSVYLKSRREGLRLLSQKGLALPMSFRGGAIRLFEWTSAWNRMISGTAKQAVWAREFSTLNLFAALEIATGAIHTQTTQYKRRVEFLEFMDRVVSDLPEDKELHVIMDNYCIHKKNEAWLSQHKNVFFHYTPTSTSWLNQVEIWLGIMSRKTLRGASFRNIEELREAIEAFVNAYGKTAKPLRNTIVNLCN